MLSVFSARSPAFLRAFLTGVSALAVIFFASAFTFARPSAAVLSSYPERAAANTAQAADSQQAASSWLHKWHVLHLEHLAHLAFEAQAAAAAQYAAEHPVQHVQQQVQQVSYTPAQPVHQAAAPYSGSGGFQSCVIAAESGGNSQVMNASGHYGLYQFSASTWAAYGGNPADFGDASVAEQNQVFANAMASPGGASNWAPYDGC